jgi:hypothetical protein
VATVRLELSNGDVVVRDLGDPLRGPLFDPITASDGPPQISVSGARSAPPGQTSVA